MENFGTKKFATIDRATELRAIIEAVYKALQTKGYDPINQLVGYLISEDPTYITGYGNARTLITQVERDELLRELLRNYLPG
jgi:uncharacterized protein (UPF0297 family)